MPTPHQTTPYAALLLRLFLGLLLLAHGVWLELGVFGLAGTMGVFGAPGYPPVFGALVALGETAAGIALLLGVRVRLASLLTLPIILGATLAHAGHGWLFSAPGGGWEFPAFLAARLLVQAGLGAGAFALDPARRIGRRAAPRRAPPEARRAPPRRPGARPGGVRAPQPPRACTTRWKGAQACATSARNR